MTTKKRIYLLYPPISKEERYSSKIGSVGGNQIPLGIFYIASYLQRYGYIVKVTDAEAYKLTAVDILKEIKEFAPAFIGISSTTVAFHKALEIADLIKKNFNDVKVILGGPQVTALPKEAIKEDCFDIGVIGEGEITFLELIKSFEEKTNLKKINGIVYKEKGKIIFTKPRGYIKNLDELPFPAYDLIENINIYTPSSSRYKALPAINIITSRGCPFRCTFCDKNVFGNIYRERSAQNIVEELKYLWKKFHMKEIAFMDDTFLINKDRIYELFELLDKEDIRFYWSCMARIDNINYKFLKFLKEKGCWNISFGIESGDEQILKIIKKDISLQQVKQVIKWCNNLDIKTCGFFILGNPRETIKTLDKTIDFACRLKLHSAVFTLNTPIPGSLQYLEANKYGVLNTDNWSKFNYWEPVFIPKGLTKEILLKKHKEAYKKFYLRPNIIFNLLKNCFGKGGFKRFKSIIKSTIFLFDKD